MGPDRTPRWAMWFWICLILVMAGIVLDHSTELSSWVFGP